MCCGARLLSTAIPQASTKVQKRKFPGHQIGYFFVIVSKLPTKFWWFRASGAQNALSIMLSGTFLATIIKLIKSTKTDAGLKVYCVLDQNHYQRKKSAIKS